MPLSSSRIIVGRGVDGFAIDVVNTSGLTLHVAGGTILVSGVFSQVQNVSLTLADDTVNFVEVDDAGTVSVNSSAFTSSRAFLYTVTTSGGKITAVGDWRFNPNVDAVTASASGSIDLTVAATGANDILAAVAATRRIVGVVEVTTVLASGTGTQPTYSVGEEGGAADKFMATSKLTNGAAGLTISFAGVLTSGKRLQVTAVAGTGNGTGAVRATALAI